MLGCDFPANGRIEDDNIYRNKPQKETWIYSCQNHTNFSKFPSAKQPRNYTYKCEPSV